MKDIVFNLIACKWSYKKYFDFLFYKKIYLTIEGGQFT